MIELLNRRCTKKGEGYFFKGQKTDIYFHVDYIKKNVTAFCDTTLIRIRQLNDVKELEIFLNHI